MTTQVNVHRVRNLEALYRIAGLPENKEKIRSRLLTVLTEELHAYFRSLDDFDQPAFMAAITNPDFQYVQALFLEVLNPNRANP